MSVIGRYNSYRPIETISDRYLFIGFIGISLSADIIIGRYQKNLYRAYSISVNTEIVKKVGLFAKLQPGRARTRINGN